jgi:hypothetical protein
MENRHALVVDTRLPWRPARPNARPRSIWYPPSRLRGQRAGAQVHRGGGHRGGVWLKQGDRLLSQDPPLWPRPRQLDVHIDDHSLQPRPPAPADGRRGVTSPGLCPEILFEARRRRGWAVLISGAPRDDDGRTLRQPTPESIRPRCGSFQHLVRRGRARPASGFCSSRAHRLHSWRSFSS